MLSDAFGRSKVAELGPLRPLGPLGPLLVKHDSELLVRVRGPTFLITIRSTIFHIFIFFDVF